MDAESGSTRSRNVKFGWRAALTWAWLIAVLAASATAQASDPADPENAPWGVLPVLLALIGASAYFSASEVAFSSLHAVRLRGMALEGGIVGPLIARMMLHRGQLLSTILIGNMITNVLIGVLMPPPVNSFITSIGIKNPFAASILTVVLTTIILVFFGEISPKVFAERISERFCRVAVLPLRGCEIILTPIRWAVLHITELVFRFIRLDDIKPAPFITDEEFRTVLNDSEQHGVIESEEGQMIQAILQIGDRMLREILVPRPDIIAIDATSTVSESIALFRKQQFSRIPMYTEDLDHITGILFAKDLLPKMAHGQGNESIRGLARRAEFVPETMNIRDFVRFAQRHRVHLAVVVDEYGGTAGIVTLEDAIEEVVGDIFDETDETSKMWKRLKTGAYRVQGNMPLDDFSDLLHVPINDDEHTTVAGFIMDQLNRVPEDGDTLEHASLLFTVERVEGKRIESLKVERQSGAAKKEAS